MNTDLPLVCDLPFKVRDLSPESVRFGRKEIELAEHEMPGLMALREELGASKPLKGVDVPRSHDSSRYEVPSIDSRRVGFALDLFSNELVRRDRRRFEVLGEEEDSSGRPGPVNHRWNSIHGIGSGGTCPPEVLVPPRAVST